MPERVRQTIRQQQEQSEILIGWIQLAIVSTFAVLYYLSPKPYDTDTARALEPWFLGIYMVFTLLRLWLAHARRLPTWLLYVSIVMDMALLLALIWSIHVKYQQPASFYLKVPTLLYVFIFIALRALRFDIFDPVGGCDAEPNERRQKRRKEMACDLVAFVHFGERLIGGLARGPADLALDLLAVPGEPSHRRPFRHRRPALTGARTLQCARGNPRTPRSARFAGAGARLPCCR